MDVISDDQTSSSSEINEGLVSKEQLNTEDLQEIASEESSPRIRNLSKVNSLQEIPNSRQVPKIGSNGSLFEAVGTAVNAS